MARITGKLAALYLGATPTKVGDVYDWSFESTNENLECSVKGDAYTRYVPSHGSARFTCSRYINTTAIITKEILDAATNGEQQTFRLDLIDANNAFTQIAGTAYISRGTINAPRGMAVDDFEMMVDGIWTVSTPGAN